MKTFRLFSMAALALMMAACSNNDDNEILQNTQRPGTMHFTATIEAPGAGATTRTEYTEITSGVDAGKINVKWKKDDEIALVHNGVVDVAKVKTVDDATGKATIEADITGSPTDNDDVYLAYPADAVYSAETYGSLPFTPNPAIIDKVKNSQDGTLAYIQDNLDLRMGSGKLAVSGDKATLKGSVSVSSLICIWKLTLQDESSNALNATKLTFINNSDIQAAAATSTGKSDYYLCVVPSFIPDASGTFSFEATVGSDTYTFSKAGLSLTAGNYYQSTVKMAPTVTLTTGQIGNISYGNQKTIGDITIALSGDAYFHAIGLMDVSGDAGPDPDPERVYAVGSFTFTTSVGKIKRIDINHDFGKWWGAGEGWPGSYDVYDKSTFTWSGTPAASVTLNGSQKGTDRCALMDVTSIVFTLEK